MHMPHATALVRLERSQYYIMPWLAFVATAATVVAAAVHGHSSGVTTQAGWPAPVRLKVEGLEQQQQGAGVSSLLVLSESLPRFAFSHGPVAMQSARNAGGIVEPAALAIGRKEVPRGLAQTAYRIRVSHDPSHTDSMGALVWDSGVVHSADCTSIVYAGHAACRTRTY